MAHPPRYAPRRRYRTRHSADELASRDDLAATGLDRPLVRLDAGRVGESTERRSCARVLLERAPGLGLPSPLRWLPLVLVLAVGAGAFFGATLALLE